MLEISKEAENKYFNPLSPCGERQENARTAQNNANAFQSTLPVRGETSGLTPAQRRRKPFQSTLPVRGETRSPNMKLMDMMIFQSTLPVRGETAQNSEDLRIFEFQSTLPVRGETFEKRYPEYYCSISIHSPRAGRDAEDLKESIFRHYFNPLSPCGERLIGGDPQTRISNFNPLSPCGERLSRLSWV